MKFYLSTCLLLTLGLTVHAAPTRVALQDALKTNRVHIVATGNRVESNPTRSTHTGKCLKIKLTNTSPTPLEYHIENAYHMKSVEDKLQDLITTENMYVILSPNQSKEITIQALCGQKSNGSPSEQDTFTLAYRHDGAIQRLTEILEKHHSFDNTAQQAMWCFTDNAPIDYILDTNQDTLIENALIHFIAMEKKIPLPKRIYAAKRQLIYPVELEGTYTHFNEDKTTIGFYFTDSVNHIYSTIIEDDTETRSGTVKFSYLYRSQYPVGTYYFKIKINGEWRVLKEVRIDTPQ